MVCGLDRDDKRTDLRVCGKHFDQVRDYNPRTKRLLSTALPSLNLPGHTEEDEEELHEQEEQMDTDDVDDPPHDNIAEAMSSISLAEENDSSAEETSDDSSSSNNSSDGEEESEIELGDVEEQLEHALGENLELKMKLKVALQRARRQSGRLAELEMPRKRDMEKYLLQNYSHAWDVSNSPFSFIALQVLVFSG